MYKLYALYRHRTIYKKRNLIISTILQNIQTFELVTKSIQTKYDSFRNGTLRISVLGIAIDI